MEKKSTSVNFVERLLDIPDTYQCILGLTLEKNPLNVLHVEKSFRNRNTYQFI